MTMTLNELAEGDFVCVDRRGAISKAQVTGLTATQIKVDTLKFRKSDGGVVGGDAWSSMSISPWNDSHEKAFNEHQRLKKIKRTLGLVSALDPKSISAKDLEALTTMINKAAQQT